MNWLSLSPLQVAAAWGGLAAIAVWLYLHNRRPQHRKVSTLRFWESVQPVAQPRRRKLREPWALLAQVLFLLLLILALANLRWGLTFEGRSVVMVFDASIWSQARTTSGARWIDQERQEAQKVLDSLPDGDRVLLLRAEADAPPILPYTTDRAALRRAIANVQPSSGTADIPHALDLGRTALNGSGRGLLVYVGPGMLDERQEQVLDEFRAQIAADQPAGAASGGPRSVNGNQPQFLVRLASDDALADNHGITRLSLRRDAAQPDRWRLLTQLKNYSNNKASLVLKLSVNGDPLGQRSIALSPNELANAENEFTWDKGGLLQAEIGPADALDADNRAILNLPTFRTVQVTVFGDGSSPFISDLLPVLASNPYVQTRILQPQLAGSVSSDVAVHQGSELPARFSSNSIWFLDGPSGGAAHSHRVAQWNAQHPVTRWIRTHDVTVRNPATLQLLPNDSVLAYAEGTPPAPLIIAREQNGYRQLIVGFNPHDSNFPLESAFPLLMAGALEWMTHSVDEAAESVSTGELNIAGPATRIMSPSGKELPFARKGGDIHFVALETGIYRVTTPGGESSVAVNTPLLPNRRLQVTPTEAAGVESESSQTGALDLWRTLVLFAVVALWLEWWLYYSSRERQRVEEIRQTPVDVSVQDPNRTSDQREEVESRKPNFVAR